jgi:hypothetical protein
LPRLRDEAQRAIENAEKTLQKLISVGKKRYIRNQFKEVQNRLMEARASFGLNTVQGYRQAIAIARKITNEASLLSNEADKIREERSKKWGRIFRMLRW